MPLQREDPRGPYHTALVASFFATLVLLGGVGSSAWWIVALAGVALAVAAPIAYKRGRELRREMERERGALLSGMRSTRR